jgi:hypothetical protein
MNRVIGRQCQFPLWGLSWRRETTVIGLVQMPDDRRPERPSMNRRMLDPLFGHRKFGG